jgi:hypothetical protein
MALFVQTILPGRQPAPVRRGAQHGDETRRQRRDVGILFASETVK